MKLCFLLNARFFEFIWYGDLKALELVLFVLLEQLCFLKQVRVFGSNKEHLLEISNHEVVLRNRIDKDSEHKEDHLTHTPKISKKV
jgi:hypothetical protein